MTSYLEHDFHETNVIVDGPCTASSSPAAMGGYNLNCHSGHVDVGRLTVSEIVTPLPGGRCLVHSIWMEEVFHTTGRCVVKPDGTIAVWAPPGGSVPTPEEAWNAAAQGDYKHYGSGSDRPTSTSVPAPPGGDCAQQSSVNMTFEINCENGKKVYIRIIAYTQSTRLPNGRCHLTRFTVRQPIKSDEDCDPAEPEIVFDWLAEEKWNERAAEAYPYISPNSQGVRLGDELRPPRMFAGAVNRIRSKEFETNVGVPETPRAVIITRIGVAPARLLRPIVENPGPQTLEVTIEESSFREKVTST